MSDSGINSELLKLTIDARKLGDGGIGVYLENLINGLLDLRDNAVLQLKLSLLVFPEALSENSKISSFLRSLENRNVTLVKEKSRGYSFSEYFFLARRHRKHLATQDLYHSPHYILPFFIGIPKVVTIHDLIHVDNPDTVLHKPIAKILIQSAIRRADAVTTVSNYSKKRIVSLVDCKNKIKVVYNAIQQDIRLLSQASSEAAKNSKSKGTKSFLFVGSDRPHKRFDVLVKAWSIFKKSDNKEAILFVVGNSYCRKVRKLVSDLGLDGSIHFLGAVSSSELNQLYNSVDAAVISSQDEGFGLVALEALACGASVVSTPLDSVREFAGESHIMFSEDFSAESIAKTLGCAAISDCKSKAIKIDCEKFSRENFALSISRVYENVLSKKLLAPQAFSKQEDLKNNQIFAVAGRR